ncbi:MAG TPA: hypothetical protein DCM08_08370 [Microscillaceae bacterium]|jgi:formate hydrogenlyase subunit 6/NADH:ubiquinone oxidoreductase subunit I|nr:hypothetical protein [Microscillaceae bacterium]
MKRQKGANNSYFGNIAEGIKTSWAGLVISFKHLWQAKKQRRNFQIAQDSYFDFSSGIHTLQYPFESAPIPDNGRYRLHNEMDDCIVCDKCAKICPVNCIDIEPIKATEQVGTTSDGSPIRLYAAKFDIDMAKCCYCGLCTTVCPTECLTMTKVYDFPETEITQMNYHFANLSPEEATEKKALLEQFQKEKQQLKESAAQASEEKATQPSKPNFTPKLKPPAKPKTIDEPHTTHNQGEEVPTQKPKASFTPKMKPKTELPPENTQDQAAQSVENKPKPKFIPKIKPKTDPPSDTTA